MVEADDHPNVQLVAQAYAALDANDGRAFFEVFDRELRFHFMRAVPSITGTHERRRGWIDGMIGPMLAATGGTFAPRPRWLRAAGDELVVGQFDVRMELDGRSHVAPAVLVFRIEDARVVEVWDIAAPDEELARGLEVALSAHRNVDRGMPS